MGCEKKRVKDDSKASGLNNCKDGGASYEDKTTEESGQFFVGLFLFCFCLGAMAVL